MQEEYTLEDAVIIQALYTAAAVGYLITRNATTAGAEGGCQAEVGSASAMAAASRHPAYGRYPIPVSGRRILCPD